MDVSIRALMIAMGTAAIALPAYAQDAQPKPEAEVVVVTGTRVAARSALSTAAPVDVVAASQLAQQGSPELNQQLAIALPSFNFPRPAIVDGTDSVRPATLRGLAPDQTLVLVNGKRRHTAALVNINGSVGRGASSVDLNTIPTGMLETVEVLRDGASAQYGSDAIAGVINLRLKQRREGGNVTVSYGSRVTTVNTDPAPPLPNGTTNFTAANIITNPTWQTIRSRDVSDGATATVNGWVGLPLFENGSLTVAAEVTTREAINRQGYDTRRLYNLLPGGALDPREATINRWNQQYGDGELVQGTLFANASIDLTDTTRLYGWASVQGRDSTSAAFFRWPADSRNVVEIYPNGFLPKINALVTDGSFAMGVETKWNGWDVDLSVNRGYNEMEFVIRNTLNRSLGVASPTSFNAGGFNNTQTVVNLSAVKGYNVGLASDLNVAVGVEARRDHYEIFAGEPGSYFQSGAFVAGSQGFGGFKPANVIGKSRDAIGGYVDLEVNVTDALLLSGAVRVEDYTDFGNNVSGKIAGRYDFNEVFALRGSVSTGFRAPSLQQQFFTASSTNVVAGVPLEILTVPSTDRIGLALGGKPLKPEESVNYSLGGVLRFGDFNVTLDAYQIELTDRIVLSENLNQPAVATLLAANGIVGINAVRFFLNGVDSTTKGADLVASYRLRTDFGRFDFTGSVSLNETKLDKVPVIPALTAIGLTPTQLFSRINSLTLTEGQPKQKGSFNTNWSHGKLGATFKATYYGEVTAPGTDAQRDLKLTPEVLFDLEGRYKVNDRITLTLGAENITDVYPRKTPGTVVLTPSTFTTLNNSGATAFSGYSPFGFSGRYVYGRVSIDF
ncbi:colicin I receptor [Candidatus Phycosocius bacilliformis]|uniref:Colicin I receptor n=1 Tax=Candidatus Phycosocius bacilliformis TaxID=1445552 RepID=A0A2P2E7M3_9PROT|nr:TonB-dependent receptor [Candidatus Phycosocius bacilliformis]GBF57044.1 colicin I receptor [Candidatus Phycosocius bacilliformis]